MADGTKVGEVYVEGYLDYDGKKTPAMMSAMRRDINRHLPDITADLKKAFSSGVSDGVDDGEKETVRRRNDHVSTGRTIGKLLGIGASMGIHDNAQLLRSSMMLAMQGAIAVIGIAISGAIQAAFTIGPAALGTLPALFLGLAAAAGVLTTALSGTSKAIKSAFSEDFSAEGWKNFEESLKGMSENFKEFAREVRSRVPDFLNFRNALQGAFFKDSVKDVDVFLSLLKQLQPEAEGLAWRFGKIKSDLLDWANKGQTAADFKQILAGVDSFVTTVEPHILRLFSALTFKGAEGATFAETFGKQVGAVLDHISEWLEKHSLAEFFDKAKPSLDDIKRIFNNITASLAILFGGDESTKGGGPLETLADMSDKIKSASQAIRNFIDDVKALPEPMKQLIAAAAIIGLLSLPVSHLVGGLFGAAQGMLSFSTSLAGLGIPLATVGIGLAIIIGVLLIVAAIFITAWLRSEDFRKKIKETAQDIKDAWNNDIKPAFEEMGQKLGEIFDKGEKILNEFGLDWGDLGTGIKFAVDGILGQITMWADTTNQKLAFISDELDFFDAKLQFLKNLWDTVWGWIKDKTAMVVDWFQNTAAPGVGNFFDMMGRKGGEVQDKIMSVWNSIRDNVFNPLINFITVSIPNAFDQGVNAISGFWDKLREKTAKPINAVIDFINDPVIAGFNKLASTLKVDLHLDPIPRIQGIPGAADGAIYPGYTPGRDIGVIGVSGGEAIMRPEWTRAVGPEYVHGANRAAKNGRLSSFLGGYADGGIIPGGVADFFASTAEKIYSIFSDITDPGAALGKFLSDKLKGVTEDAGIAKLPIAMAGKVIEGIVNALKDKLMGGGSLGSGGRSVERLIAMVKSTGMNYTVNSTDRPGDPGYHGQGKAVDFGGDMNGIAGFFMKTAGALLELIHGDSHSFVKNGKVVGADFYGAETVAQHASWGGNEHVHVAMNGDAMLGGQNPQLGMGANLGGAVGASPAILGAWITAALGYTSIEWVEGLKTLIMRESGGNPYAVNLTDTNAQRGDPSGGLMQTIGATFRAYRDPRLPNNMFDPVANIVAGMNYIHSRYGSLFNVQQAHAELPPKGYSMGGLVEIMDQGGGLGPGGHFMANLTGKPEAILNPRQSAFVGRILSGESLVVENHLYIDGEPIRALARQEIGSSNASFVSVLNSGRGL